LKSFFHLRSSAKTCVDLRSPFFLVPLALASILSTPAHAQPHRRHWLWSTAHAIPKETTSEGSGYFSIVGGHNSRIYVGTAKYRHNAYLVEFDPATKQMRVVMDAHKEIGTTATGFAAQAKLHTRNNVGESGRIYVATKQGYPQEGEQRTDYPGGYPLVYDPATGTTRVYPIPVPHQGIISITPDESRNVAYISTCSDERPVESSHFMVLDLDKGTYRDLLDCRHMYAFIVLDAKRRAYHPILGGDVARYDPAADRLDRLNVLVDGRPPTPDSHLADAESHPINWEISLDRKTLYAVAMSGNQLYSFDVTGHGDTLHGQRLGKLIADAESTDCRAMCVAPDGTVWAGVAATFTGHGQYLHLVSWRPGDAAPTDHGPIAIGNPDYTEFTGADGKPLPWHHGVHRPDPDGPLLPRYVVMGICAAGDGAVYVTTLAPFTVHEVRFPRVAGVTTIYRHNAHADVILSRLLQTDTLDGKGEGSPLKLAGLYTDQVPKGDYSRPFSAKYAFPIFDSVAATLTLGGDKLAVDGVLLVAEHGEYPKSDTGQTVYPKRRLFTEVAETFGRTGRSVPVFIDKHLADNWEDAHWIYQTARELHAPLMAGSSLPTLWRYPPTDVRRGARLKEIVAVSYHTLDAYGFHALEMVQSLVERRAGGETGIASVQCLTGEAVWQAGRDGIYDGELLRACLTRLRERPIPEGKRLEDLVPEPILFVIDYRDGLRANVLTLNGAVGEWSAAWRYADDNAVESTLFWTQEARPYMHFTYLVKGIEQLVQTDRPPYPVERTLLTSGVLDALLISKREAGRRLETPDLAVEYQSDWNWKQPPDPPPGRPSQEQ
jgi:sugar lactone lactonase YvrE